MGSNFIGFQKMPFYGEDNKSKVVDGRESCGGVKEGGWKY
jgi:hypothetical protein